MMTALTKGTAHGPPVGFGMIIGFEDNATLPPPPCVELFSVTEQLWDIGADADGDDDAEKVKSDIEAVSPAPSPWVMLIVNGDMLRVEDVLPLTALVEPVLLRVRHMELSTLVVILPIFVVENMLFTGFEVGFDDVADVENGWVLSLWSLNPIASLSSPISSWPSLACVQVSFPL